MKIWKRAERVFGLSLYGCWIDAAMGRHPMTHLPPARGQAAVAMLGVASDTQLDLAQLPRCEAMMKRVLASTPPVPSLEWFDFTWLPQQPAYLAEPRDNGGFLASVCFYTPDPAFDLVAWIECFRAAWARAVAEALRAGPMPTRPAPAQSPMARPSARAASEPVGTAAL
jgi:hypothetical protein